VRGRRRIRRDREVRHEPDDVTLARSRSEDLGEDGARERMRLHEEHLFAGRVERRIAAPHQERAHARGGGGAALERGGEGLRRFGRSEVFGKPARRRQTRPLAHRTRFAERDDEELALREERGSIGDHRSDRSGEAATQEIRTQERALEIAALEKTRATIGDGDVVLTTRIQMRGRRDDGRRVAETVERAAQLAELIRRRVTALRELETRLEDRRAQIGARETIVETNARELHRLVDRSGFGDALRRRAFFVVAGERGIDERGERGVARRKRTVAGCTARMTRDPSLDGVERRRRRAEDARERDVPARIREVRAARALFEIDEVVLVAMKTDAREQTRRGHAFPECARDAAVDRREDDLVFVGRQEGESGPHGRPDQCSRAAAS
jgi:hypothetical protein